MIKLIKSGDPPRNYVERRANKLKEEPNVNGFRDVDTNQNVQGFYGTTTKEYASTLLGIMRTE